MAIATLKTLNNMSPSVLANLINLRENSTHNFRYNNILQVPQSRTSNFGKKSLRYAAAVLLNRFLDEFRRVNNFGQFKSMIANWNGEDCKCNLCR